MENFGSGLSSNYGTLAIKGITVLKNIFLGLCIYMPLLGLQLYDEALTEPILQAINQNFRKITVYAYQDHPTVTQSLMHGLQVLGVNFNLNPPLKEVGDGVIVLAGLSALSSMILLKEQNKIKTLITGPNIVQKAWDNDKIVAHALVNSYLTPCEHVKKIGEIELPERHDHIRVWYAGVDEMYWHPKNAKKNKRKALVYWKTETKNFCDQVCNVLRQNNWEPLVVRYGKYNKEEYRKKLNKVQFAVFLSKVESQGIALAESWSMNVPTLVWNPGDVHKGILCSSAPYLNDAVGMQWVTCDDLNNVLKVLDLKTFSSRQWVLSNMTDRISALQLLKIMLEV